MQDLSTAGTTASVCIMRKDTASVCIMRKDRMLDANVGDSTVVLGIRSETLQSTYPATLEALILTIQNKRESKLLVVA